MGDLKSFFLRYSIFNPPSAVLLVFVRCKKIFTFSLTFFLKSGKNVVYNGT